MSFFLEVFQSAFSPMVLFYMIAGVAAGICIGALPGLTATMGVALLLPLTFGMDATAGILMLLGIYVGAIYGGSISAILLHTPGTPASAATAIDGSINSFLGLDLIELLDRMFGDHAGTSSMTNNLFNALI